MPEDISNFTDSTKSSALSPEKSNTIKKILPFLAIVLIIVLCIFAGFFLSGKKNFLAPGLSGTVPTEKITKGSEFGSNDTSKFKDTATGVLESGGLDGEGTHKLTREGGPSQTVYLTSSVLDLDQFVGKKVQVWGETFTGQKAGWLMDVGRIKVLE